MEVERRDIVVGGGSYAGVSVSHYILKHILPKLPQPLAYRVVLINPSSEAFCRPAAPRAMLSDDFFDQSKLFVNIPDQFKNYSAASFLFVQATIERLDHLQRKLEMKSLNGEVSPLTYHSLVIATGASTPSPLLGVTRNIAHLRESWAKVREWKPAYQIVLAGGGPAGVETAGELGEFFNGPPVAKRTSAQKVDIKVITSRPQILPYLRPIIAAKAETYLSHLGVSVMKNMKIIRVEPEEAGQTLTTSPATIFFENGQQANVDLYIPATGTSPNTSFVDPGLLARDRRIATNPSTLRVETLDRVYAIGDVSSAARPAIHIIIEQVPVLCANLKRDLLLAEAAAGLGAVPVGEDRIFKEDKRETQMVLIGRSNAVGAAMGWSLPGWVVKMIKRDYWLWTTPDLWSGKQWAKEK